MNFLLLALCSLMLAAPTDKALAHETSPQLQVSESLSSEQLSFHYQPNEFEGASCRHERVREDLPDWKVTCKSRYHDKEFGVHLVVKKYRRTDQSETKYEVLYWVTNRKNEQKRNEYGGTTLNFILHNDVKAKEVRIGQMVDRGYADLNISLNLNF